MQGGFYYIPLSVQKRIFNKVGRKNYIKLPKPGTNPRGVEISSKALLKLVNNKESKSIIINWKKIKIKYNSFKRWVTLWRKD